jgi:hypothetical protein
MKRVLLVLSLFIVCNCNAQRLRPFFGSTVFIHNDFKSSLFLGFNSGVEFNVIHFFKPELEISYFLGAIEDIENQDEKGNVTDVFFRNAYGLNFSFIPKIDIGSRSNSSEVGMVHFQILPKYTISKNKGVGTYSIINPNNPLKSLIEREVIEDWQHSLGIGIGLHFAISHKNYNSISLNLHYNTIDLGVAVNKLKYGNNYKFNTNNTIGVGINYYLGLKRKINN